MNIKNILKDHEVWIESNGIEGIKADLSGYNLSSMNLSWADLSRTNLTHSDLSRSNLMLSDLSGADLSRASFWDCRVDGKYIKTLGEIGPYIINYSQDCLQIGCKHYSFEEWLSFNNRDIDDMDIGALKFWKDNKTLIFDSIAKNKALPTSET